MKATSRFLFEWVFETKRLRANVGHCTGGRFTDTKGEALVSTVPR